MRKKSGMTICGYFQPYIWHLDFSIFCLHGWGCSVSLYRLLFRLQAEVKHTAINTVAVVSFSNWWVGI